MSGASLDNLFEGELVIWRRWSYPPRLTEGHYRLGKKKGVRSLVTPQILNVAFA